MEKVEERLKNIESAISKIENNESKFIFLCPDTKGAAVASVANIYRQAIILKNSGLNVSILHEKNDYIKPTTWLGQECEFLEHNSIENDDLVVGPQDVIIIPEIYGGVFEQILHLPVYKIIMVQHYDHLLDNFSPGKSWADYDVSECLTTNSTVANMISEILPYQPVKFINPLISGEFKPSEKPKKLTVAVHAKEQRKAAKLIKTFYLKYPLYRFLSFKDMHGMTESDFARNLKECALSVWIDDESTFGTFPIESMKCNVPVIGKVPNIIPEWMEDENGIWVYDENQIPDLIFNFIKNWMEDSLPENLNSVSLSVKDKYDFESFEKSTVETYKSFMNNNLSKLNKIKENFEKNIINK
jgi:hypothetical protein